MADIEPSESFHRRPDSDLPGLLPKLAALLGDRFSTSASMLDQYGKGESFPTIFPPDGVAFPQSTLEVSQIVSLCHQHRVPMVASGAATSLEGHITAPYGGIAINLMQMNAIVEVNHYDLD